MALLFSSSFEGDIKIQTETRSQGQNREIQTISGTDSETRFSWDRDLPAPQASFVYLTNSTIDPYVKSEIQTVDGPGGKPARALYMAVVNQSEKAHCINRNEFSLFTEPDFTQGYIRYHMKLQENLIDLSINRPEKTSLGDKAFTGELPDRPDPADKHYWRLFMECKEPDGGGSSGTNNFRFNLWLKAISDKIWWVGTVQQVQPERITEWEAENRQVPVPLGEWFQLEFFWKKGKKGRIWFAVNGIEVFSFNGRTEHGSRPMDLKFWSPFKLYADPDWFADSPMEQWITDVEIWSDFPDGHPMAGKGGNGEC